MREWTKVEISFPGDLPLPLEEVAALIFPAGRGLVLQEEPPALTFFQPGGGPPDLDGVRERGRRLGLSWPGWPEEYTSAERIGQQSWERSWQDHFGPLRAGGVLVLPEWIEPGGYPGDTVLRIYPGMAFGTGDHPTTRGCLDALGDLVCQGRLPRAPEVVDVGTGSGILALAALMLTEGRAWGLDSDPLALENADHNARLNGLSERLTLARGTFPRILEEVPPAHVLTANLDAYQIQRGAAQVGAAVREGGYLILSGFITAEARQVEGTFSDLGWPLLGDRGEGGWSALVLGPGPG